MRYLCVLVAALLAVSGTAQIRPGQRQPGRQKAQDKRWQLPPQLPPALRQMLGAVGRVPYSGSRVVEAKSGQDRERHTELVITDGPNSRIEFPADSPMHGQVIVETPTERRHFLPARNELQILPPRREEAFGRIAQMVANGRAVVNESSGGNVAGLATQLVTIADKQGNVLQKLWIEPRTGVILKREIYGRGGALEASSEFTQVNLRPIVHPTDFVFSEAGVNVVTPEKILQKLIKRGGFQEVRILPRMGFRLEAARIQKIADQDVLVQQYAGNGHRVTLYQLKTAVDPKRLGMLERPDLQIYSWQSGGSSFVLVADLSDAELRELGRRLGG